MYSLWLEQRNNPYKHYPPHHKKMQRSATLKQTDFTPTSTIFNTHVSTDRQSKTREVRKGSVLLELVWVTHWRGANLTNSSIEYNWSDFRDVGNGVCKLFQCRLKDRSLRWWNEFLHLSSSRTITCLASEWSKNPIEPLSASQNIKKVKRPLVVFSKD